MEVEKVYLTADDVMIIMGVSKGTAYRFIHQCNKELKAKGKLTAQGKVNKDYFMSKVKV